MDEEEELENTLIGQEEAPGINTGDVMMGGLGLGGAAFAAQTGRAPTPTPSGPLSPFAQRVAANDAARLAAQPKPPALIGSTQVATTTGFQPPAVTSTTGTPATTTTAGGQTAGGQRRLPGSTRPSASDFDFKISPARASRLARVGGPGALIYGTADLATEALTGRSLSERIGEGGGGFVGNLLFPGAQSQPAFTEAELQQSIDNLSPGAQLDIMREDAEASVAPVTEVTPLQAALGALDEEIAGREANIVSNQVELAKQINELGTVSDDQRAVQNFMDERAERSGTTATDVITPFQEQAQLTADLFTDPNTAIGQFVPRATFTLPDGTIIQEDEGGNRREISAEQLRQFEQDMAGLGQPSVVGLGKGGDAGVIKSFDRPMGVEETRARLQQIAGAPTIREIQEQGAVAPPVAFQDASAEREARLAQRDRLSGETQTERDTRIAQSRTQGATTSGLKMSDAVDLAGGDRDLARTMVVRSRMGLDPMTGKPKFEPRIVNVGDEQVIQLAPEYFQKLRKDTPNKTGLQKTLEDLQADLDSGRLTQEEYDIATKNARDLYIRREKPKPAKPEETSGLIDMDGEAPVATETAPQTRVTINTQAEYDALAVGTPYIDSQGTPGIKK
jgi:hypothetical protein